MVIKNKSFESCKTLSVFIEKKFSVYTDKESCDI